MKNSICFLVLALCFSIKGYSQFESPSRTFKISPKKKPDAPLTPTSPNTSPAVITYESSLNKNKDEKLLKGISLLPKKEEKSIMDTSDPTLRNIAEVHTKVQNDKLKSEGLSMEIVNSDVFLGEFVVYTPKIKTRARDYGAIDGDLIRVWVNDEMAFKSLELASQFQDIVLDLKVGVNIIKIQALNTGEAFPNTGQFVFYDGNGKVVTNQNWGLNAGYNAIIKVRRIDGIAPAEK